MARVQKYTDTYTEVQARRVANIASGRSCRICFTDVFIWYSSYWSISSNCSNLVHSNRICHRAHVHQWLQFLLIHSLHSSPCDCIKCRCWRMRSAPSEYESDRIWFEANEINCYRSQIAICKLLSLASSPHLKTFASFENVEQEQKTRAFPFCFKLFEISIRNVKRNELCTFGFFVIL